VCSPGLAADVGADRVSGADDDVGVAVAVDVACTGDGNAKVRVRAGLRSRRRCWLRRVRR
jgi:hypothetical protein